VEKVSLKLANMQGLVGPKLLGKPLQITKGNQVNIPELHILDNKAVKPSCQRTTIDRGTEELSFLHNNLQSI